MTHCLGLNHAVTATVRCQCTTFLLWFAAAFSAALLSMALVGHKRAAVAGELKLALQGLLCHGLLAATLHKHKIVALQSMLAAHVAACM